MHTCIQVTVMLVFVSAATLETKLHFCSNDENSERKKKNGDYSYYAVMQQ